MNAPPLFMAITGPTTSGKTDLSLAVAERIPAEVISMDSRQVYLGMDVGTDKVSAADRGRVAHHGLDLVRPDQRYSAGQFARDARRWIEEIRGRGNVPILVGGTGFFLRAVLEPVFTEPEMDRGRVEALRAYLAVQPRARLEAWVRQLDPDRAEVAVQGGPQRMSRTLEVALLTGRPLSTWHREAPLDGAGLPGVVILLELPRDEMDRRIDDRVTRMEARGLVDEVRRLLEAGYGDEAPGMTGTGYREIALYLQGDVPLAEALDRIRRATRQYARRQLTWFRNQLPEGTPVVDAMAPLDHQADAVLAAWMRAEGDLPAHPSTGGGVAT